MLRKSNEFQENGLHLINQLLLDYLKAKKGVSLKARQKDIDWYEQCGITITNMKNDLVKELAKKYELTDEQLKKNVAVIREIQQFDKIIDTILIEHIVDMQDFNNKLLLYQYLYSGRVRAISNNQQHLEEKIKDYLEKNVIKTSKNLVGIILFDNNLDQMYVLSTNNIWTLATPLQKGQLLQAIKEDPRFIINKSKINTIIGYISYDNKYGHTFKIKNNELKRHTGASCDQMNKDKKIQLLNDLAGYIKYKKYSKEEIAKEGEKKSKKVKDKEKKREGDTTGMIKEQMCSLIEFMMRYNTIINKDDKIWFLNNDKYILNKIE